MRKLDREDAVAHEADEIAGDQFDRYLPHVAGWVRDAFVGEHSKQAEDAAKDVMFVAAELARTLAGTELERSWLRRLRRAVGGVREEYVDYASVHGLYAAEAEDAVNSAISDAAEAQRDIDIDNVNLRG